MILNYLISKLILAHGITQYGDKINIFRAIKATSGEFRVVVFLVIYKVLPHTIIHVN
jgi:hypothetical protein